MCRKKRFLFLNIEVPQVIINLDGVQNLCYVFLGSYHSLVFEQGGYLLFRQGVSLDFQGMVYSLDLVPLSQLGRRVVNVGGNDLSDQFRDAGNQF